MAIKTEYKSKGAECKSKAVVAHQIPQLPQLPQLHHTPLMMLQILPLIKTEYKI